MTKFKTCAISETCFRMAHFSERQTMPILNLIHDGTCFKTARNTQSFIYFYQSIIKTTKLHIKSINKQNKITEMDQTVRLEKKKVFHHRTMRQR